MKLLDNLYCYIWRGNGNNGNSFLIGGESPTLIDPGHITNEMRELCLAQLTQEMREDGFGLEDVKLVLNTHLHPDHCQADGEVAQRGGAKIAYHRDEEQMLSLFRGRSRGGYDFKPDFYLEEGDLPLGDGKITLKVYHTPGHSPGSVCFYWPEAKALITGDLIFPRSVGRVDLPGGSGPQLVASVERMAELDVEYILPGHMGLIQGKQAVQRNFQFIRDYFFGEFVE